MYEVQWLPLIPKTRRAMNHPRKRKAARNENAVIDDANGFWNTVYGVARPAIANHKMLSTNTLAISTQSNEVYACFLTLSMIMTVGILIKVIAPTASPYTKKEGIGKLPQLYSVSV